MHRLKYIFSAAILVCSSFSFAGSQQGKVTQILVRDDGLHWFYLSGSRGVKPKCAENHNYWMIQDENSVYGQSQFSMLLSAYMAGETVVVEGKNACGRWRDGESIATVILKK